MPEEFDPSAKKKKKKKLKTSFLEGADDVGAEESGTAPADDAQEARAADDTMPPPAAEGEGMFAGKRKKKKPKAKLRQDEVDVDESIGAEYQNSCADMIDAKIGDWHDYSYDEMLERGYMVMKERNPELAGERKKYIMKPPQVIRIGSKRTGFVNFTEICKFLKRDPKHLLKFLLAESGTSGSLDAKECLILKGRFQPKHFESLLRKYLKEYVNCLVCKSKDTRLQKDARLCFLHCNMCSSRRSVQAIKSGFQAQTTKRAKIRAAAGQ